MKQSNVTLLILTIVAIYGNPTGAGGADAGPLVLVYTVRNSTDYQRSLGPHGTEPIVRLEISRARHRLTVYHGAVPIKQYPVAVGRAGWETPVGDFRVFQMFEDPDWKHPLT